MSYNPRPATITPGCGAVKSAPDNWRGVVLLLGAPLCAVAVEQLPARGEPRVAVLTDVLQYPLEVTSPERVTDQERV